MLNTPYLAKLTMDGVVFMHAYFALWDLNLIPADLVFNNLSIMKQMGQVNSIVCPTNALLYKNTHIVAGFKINDAIFFNQNLKNEKIA